MYYPMMLTFVLIEGLLPSDLFLNDGSSLALASSEVDSDLDISIGENLLGNSGVIDGVDPAWESPFLEDINDSFSNTQISMDAEFASNDCARTLPPSRKIRKRVDECDAVNPVNPVEPDPKLPTLESIEDMLQESLQRKWCSEHMFPGLVDTLVCAFSGQMTPVDSFFHVSGHLCEYIVV